MQRTIKRLSRFSLRSLILFVALVACICWLVPRWGELLVTVRADRILVPLGIAIYDNDFCQDWTIRENGTYARTNGHADRAVWISNENCNRCHVGIKSLLAFPIPNANAINIDSVNSPNLTTN